MKPLIGITCPWSVETWGDSVESGGYYYLGKAYVEVIQKYGGIPLLITPEHVRNNSMDEDITQILDTVQGILFSGGGDAKKFSSEELPDLKAQQETRYNFETSLMNEAYNRKTPVLGICRGFQMMIEVFGGSLEEKIIKGHKQDIPGWKPWHKVFINKESRLGKVVREEEWDVNSFHIQEVNKVPKGFIISAKAEDGVIEGIEATNHPFFLGVQFHPEELEYKDEKAGEVIKDFVNESKKHI